MNEKIYRMNDEVGTMNVDYGILNDEVGTLKVDYGILNVAGMLMPKNR